MSALYLDPSLGSLLIQVLVASIAAIAALFGVYRAKIKAFFSKNKKSALEKTDD